MSTEPRRAAQAVESFPVGVRVELKGDIFPIFRIEERDGGKLALLEQTGTGFRLSDDLVVTCWHCVGEAVPYAAVVDRGSGSFWAARLLDVEQDAAGTDLATARLDEVSALPGRTGLLLSPTAVAAGFDVLTWGYPMTTTRTTDEGELSFTLHPRYLEGYVTRSFWYEHHTYGAVATYEVAMPAPAGLSGSPLLRRGTTEVIGVVYGRTESVEIDAFATVDPDTGERHPEVQRVVSFAAAHYTQSLHALSGKATDGKPLVLYLEERTSAIG